MAGKPPDDLPESIVLGRFSGVRNTVARERLAQDELESAVNVDLDDSGQARRRRGFILKDASAWHSVRSIGGRILGVKDGALGVVGTNYSFTSLGATVGPERLSYAQVADTTYFSSLTASGKILDMTVSPWGQVADAGQWLSPVVTPTDTLGAMFGKQIQAPPMATEIEAYNGRIYLAAGRYLWGTELWLLDFVDKTRNFLQFEDDITMLAAMNDGLFVGTASSLHFLKGALSSGLQRSDVLSHGVIRGSKVVVPATDVHPAARGNPMPEAMAAVFMTTRGVSAGFDGGQVYDLTYGKVEFPVATSAAALYRQDQGMSSYVAVTDSAGGPTTNAKIGDYVEGEIVRAADRV